MLAKANQHFCKSMMKRSVGHALFCNSSRTDNLKNMDQEQIEMFTKIHSRKGDKVLARKPAYPFDDILSVETPSLILDHDIMSSNMTANKQTSLRPQYSIHKCSDILDMQCSIHGSSMTGVCVSTIADAECLMHSPTNFISNNQSHVGFTNLLLKNITIDVHKMWRFVQLLDTPNKKNVVLSVLCDDIMHIHLWNHSMRTLKEQKSHLLSRHSSIAADTTNATDFGSRIGIVICLKSVTNDIGIDISNNECSETIKQIVHLINNDYSDNLYLKGFDSQNGSEIVDACDVDIVNEWKLNSNDYDESYDTEYVFDNGGLSILSAIVSVYQNGKQDIHVLDCGFENFNKIPIGIVKYHAPQYAVTSGDRKVVIDQDNYEIIAHKSNHCLLITNNEKMELDIGGKVQLLIDPNCVNDTVNLYNYYTVISENKVKQIWNIDARGPGN